MKKKKGFTLIELLAVIVILAIIALITIPIVIRTINNSTEESEKQSIMGYARAIEADAANFIIENPNKRYADYVISDTLEYKGNTVICSNSDGQVFQDNKLVLLNCYVTNKKREEITDIEEEGKNKNHYNYDNGKITKISNDNNENNSSVYEVYNVGDKIQVSGDNSGDYYYVIASSDSSQDYVVALKENPLTVEEVNTYGTGHVNMYNSDSSDSYYHQAYNQNGYGGMAYYTSSTCGRESGSYEYVRDGCTTSYDASEIKYVVDNWSTAKFKHSELKTVNGYVARLISYEELLDNLGYENQIVCTESCYYDGSLANVPTWVYNSQYRYWTMSQNGDSNWCVWGVHSDGLRSSAYIYHYDEGVVRPVINLYKSKIKK